MNCAARLFLPSVPDLDQAVLGRGGDNVWTIWIAADPADQPGVGWRIGVGKLQLGTPDAEPEILADCGGSVFLVGALPDVKSRQLVLVLRHWSLGHTVTIKTETSSFQESESEWPHSPPGFRDSE